MSASTNSLVAKAKRAAVPVGAVAAVLALGFAFNHGVAHAAIGAAAPMDESSVSSLTALDNAVEAVAARVTPAVVNVSVTSRGHSDEGEQDGEASGIPPGALPPGFEQFFGGQGGRRDTCAARGSRSRWNTASAAASSFLRTATS